jgi:DNA-damage-inducible protein D
MNKKKLSKQGSTIFEQIRRVDENGNEYWSARDFSKVLKYVEYRNFIPVINRAKDACLNSGQPIDHHFVDMSKIIITGKGVEKQIRNMKLSRYACYLIVQDGDPSKEIIALGQTYFSIQTGDSEVQENLLLVNLCPPATSDFNWQEFLRTGFLHHIKVIDKLMYSLEINKNVLKYK